jgi:plasmid segregation protein ParM
MRIDLSVRQKSVGGVYMNIVGGDIGFKQFKVSTDSIHFKFTNVIGIPSPLEIKQFNHSNNILEDLSVKHLRQRYYVGEKAIQEASNHRYTFLAKKIDKVDEEIKMLAALGTLHHYNIREIDLFVTTVPVEEYHLVKKKIKAQFKKQYSFTFRREKILMNVKQVEVIPQGAGDYYDYILTEEGLICEEKVLPKTLIINIGYRTTEIVTMNFGKFSRTESTTLYTATNSFHKELRRLLVKEYGIRKNLTQIDQIYRDGCVDVNGTYQDISLLKEEAVLPHVTAILGEIPIWVNIDDVHEVILTGGGSIGLKEYFQQEFGCPVHEMHEINPCLFEDQKYDPAEFGNARGARKYGKLIANA